MRAIETTATSIIQQIKNNLRDNYAPGFPILKELIQNADDAEAEHLNVMLLAGLRPEDSWASHPLLSGPALVVVNDGYFLAEDEKKIFVLGEGNKGSKLPTIGKFGLGLKSVFHLGESLFYLAHPESSATPVRSEFINVWANTQQHPEWRRDLSERDVARMHALIQPMITDESHWFCLWVPLRSEEHHRSVPPLIAEYPGDSVSRAANRDRSHPASLGLLFGEDYEHRVASLFPLLKHMRRLYVWAADDRNVARFSRRIVLAETALTTTLFDRLGPYDGELSGTVQVERDGTPRDSPLHHTSVLYCGCERWLRDARAELLRTEDAWPTQTSTNIETGEERSEKEKAVPHVAVYWVARPAEQAARMRLVPTVFLPLGDAAVITEPCSGEDDFELVLHGYFFVDAGRRGVSFDASDSESMTSVDRGDHREEQDVRLDWNRLLRDSGILPLILPALDRFAERSGRDSERMDRLMDILSPRKVDGGQHRGAIATYFQEHRSAIGKEYQWVKRLDASGARWELVRNGEAVHSLPPPRPSVDTDDAKLDPVKVLPGLNDLSADLVLTCDGRCLTTKPPEPLRPAALAQLLSPCQGFDAAAVLADLQRAEYVMDVVSHVQRGRPSSAELCTALIHVARAVFRQSILGTTSSLITPLRRLIAAIPPDRRLALKSEGAIPQEVLALDLQILIVPSVLDPSADSPSSGMPSIDDAVQLLTALASARNSASNTGPLVASLAFQVLAACEESVRKRVLESCRDLHLFEGKEVNSQDVHACSFRELQAAYTVGLLFSESRESRNTARLLQCAIHKDRILLIERRTGDTLFGKLAECGPTECIQALSQRTSLGSPADRVGLLQYLLHKLTHGRPQYTWSPTEIRGLRLLLHGRVSAWDDTDSLFQPPPRGPWAELLKQALGLDKEDWRVIPLDLTAQLNPTQSLRLNLRGVDAVSVSQHLSAQWKRAREQLPNTDLDADTESEFWSQLQLDKLSDIDLKALLDEFPINDESSRKTLRALPLHPTMSGKRASIGVRGFLDDPERGYELDDELRKNIIVFAYDMDPIRAARQKQLFGERQLTSHVLVTLAAAENGLPVHWGTLLCALKDVPRHPKLEDLRLKSWVPTRTGFVAPVDVPFIPDVDLRQELPDIELICASDLLPEFLEHKHFAAGRKLLLSAEESLQYLGCKLSVHDRYLLGPPELADQDLSRVLSAFAGDEECMPCRSLLTRLVECTSAEKCGKHLVSRLLGPIQSTERWIAILNYLAKRDETEGAHSGLRALFDLYLDGAKRHPAFRREVLPKIRLLSAAGKWRSTSTLCVDWPGVDANSALNPSQARILSYSDRNTPAEVEPETSNSPQDHFAPDSLLRESDKSAEILKRYCSRWTAAPPGAVAAFLCLFGDHPKIVHYAEERIQPRRVAGLRDMLPWHVLEGRFAGAGLSAEQSIGQCRFMICLDKGTSIRAINLLGEVFSAPVANTPDHLLMGKPEPLRDRNMRVLVDRQGNQYHRVVLRDLDISEFSPTKASELLRESAQLMLKHVYWQWQADLQSVWPSFAESDQLDITVTQQILLDRAPANLPKLRTDKIPSLRGPLRELDEAFHRLEEAKQTIAGVRDQRLEVAEDYLGRAKQKLRDLLTDNAVAQGEVVQALREKVRESGYDESSIPFELLQNADDAAVEYLEMHGCDENALPGGARMAVTSESGRVCFMHWGRPINKYRHNQFDGSDRGFRSDLSKMLALGESDKLTGVDVKNTTGRFGLGFKSVFLVTDRPRVISGWLAFEVVGGIFPDRLKTDEVERLRGDLQRRGPLDGTLIELPLADRLRNESDEDCLSRFLDLAHLLVACTRQIRRLELNVEGRTQEFIWNPTTIDAIPGAWVGRVRPWDESAAPFSVVVLGTGRSSFIMRIDGRGPAALDRSVPTIWATAPTRHFDDIGTIVNGDFDLDPGRSHLRGESVKNRSRAAELGRALGEQLVQLYDAAERDWSQIQALLQLDQDVTPTVFWQNAFELLAKRFIRSDGDSQELMNEVLWQSAERGMYRLIESRRVIPSGLPAPFAESVRLNEIRHTVDSSLLDGSEPAFTKVVTWPSFRKRIVPGSCVSDDIRRVLSGLSVSLPDLSVIGTATLLRNEIDGNQVGAESAERVAAVLKRQQVEAAAEDLRHGRSNKLGELLRDAEFLACDGRWYSARELLIAEGNDDEALRATFAPESAVLASQYHGSALEFVRLCRLMHAGRMRIDADSMCNWAMAAEEDDSRVAVLQYLAGGDLARSLANAIKERIARNPLLWPVHLEDEGLLRRAFPYDVNRQQLVLALLGLLKTVDSASDPLMEEDEIAPIPPPDPGTVLRRIAAAWRLEAGRSRYEAQVYAGELPPKCSLENLGTDLTARKEWMRLLMTGSLHTMGISQPSEYGNFVGLCRQRGWLDVFADPRITPDRWLNVLDDFLDPAVRYMKYHRAMQRFICFYQAARHLRDYAYCFDDMNREGDFGTLSQVLRPRENSRHSGGGSDAPPLTQALGIGACFVVRELVCGGFVRNPAAHRYCYVPVRRIVRLLIGMGCAELKDSTLERWELSAVIYEFLCKHLGPQGATFGGDFDLPLLAAVGGNLRAYGFSDECERFVLAGSEDSQE